MKRTYVNKILHASCGRLLFLHWKTDVLLTLFVAPCHLVATLIPENLLCTREITLNNFNTLFILKLSNASLC